MLKKLEVNMSFAKALAQMPNYVKFMKKIMSNKKMLDTYGTVSLLKNCSAIVQRKLPEKLRDPSIFTIPCVISGTNKISKRDYHNIYILFILTKYV